MRRPLAAAMVLCIGGFQPPPATAQTAYSKGGSLVTLVPGIRDEASHAWVASAAALAPTRERWVIREAGVDEYADLRGVPQNHIITLSANASPDQIRKTVHAIAATKDVTVIVDMKIGMRITAASWKEHTTWAGNVARALAETHAEQFPAARNLYVGHSAGTEPIRGMPANRPDAQHKWHRMYDEIMLLSPRRGPDDTAQYPHHAVMAFADGDFYANVGSTTSRTASTLRTYGERDAVAFASKGFSVVRVEDGGRHGDVWEHVSIGRTSAHREVTDLVYPDRKLVYYESGTAKAFQMPASALSSGLKFGADVQSGKITDISAGLSRIKAREPTPGIGGISLNATAYVPVDPAEVDYASYSSAESRLYLRLKSGKTLKLPPMDPQVLRQSYDVTYVAGKKAELSIGQNRATSPDGDQVLNQQAPGKFSVHYFGGTQDTELGLIMYQADDMLGNLAFSISDSERDVARRIPGFRSLIELFPEKYAHHPSQGDYTGHDLRIFLSPGVVEFVRARTAGELAFGEFAFKVHFARPGPAELAFAAFFEQHAHEILQTSSGAAFTRLMPYARATALFRWMREGRVRFEPAGLDRVETTSVFTPNATEMHKSTELDDVAVQPPTMFFGLEGPTRIVQVDGRETTFTYENSKLSEVHRYDGQVLRVIRDSVGVPLAVQWTGGRAIAFLTRPGAGLLLAKRVTLNTGGDLGVNMGAATLLYTIVDPESIARSYAMRFAGGEVNL